MSYPAASPRTFHELKTNIRQQHIEQLRNITVLEEDTQPHDEQLPTAAKQDVLQWVKDQTAAINAAIAAQGTGGDAISWQIAMFVLIESAAVYLRKDTSVFKAIDAAKRRDDDAAHKHLEEAQQDIDDIAKAMGLRFTVICDLVKYAPEGHWLWCGAFCGVFFPEDKETKLPFLGFTFKGTSTASEGLVDLAYTPIAPQGDILYAKQGVKVHEGFYNGMFGKYNQPSPGTVPFDYMMGGLTHAANYFTQSPVPMHTTGHSLGGAYASLAYAEMLRTIKYTDPASFSFKELYTLGGPRVSLQPLPNLVKSNIQSGQHTWRIASDGDPVATVPPAMWPTPQYDYIHFDNGVKVFEDKKPEPIPSEITHGRVSHAYSVTHHYTDYYYKCLTRALQ